MPDDLIVIGTTGIRRAQVNLEFRVPAPMFVREIRWTLNSTHTPLEEKAKDCRLRCSVDIDPQDFI